MPIKSLPKRILLKVSGEMLKGTELDKDMENATHASSPKSSPNQHSDISSSTLLKLAHSIAELLENGIEVGIVLGGGNIFRGLQGEALGVGRISADFMGMLATVINGIALQEALKQIGVHAILMSAIPCGSIAPDISIEKAKVHLKNKMPVIFSGGTGNPFFTTDTAAALRASEIEADLLVKATKVSGIFSEDPFKKANVQRYTRLSCAEVLEMKLNVMDATAIALCMNNDIPIFVFKLWEKDSILEALQDISSGTIVYTS